MGENYRSKVFEILPDLVYLDNTSIDGECWMGDEDEEDEDDAEFASFVSNDGEEFLEGEDEEGEFEEFEDENEEEENKQIDKIIGKRERDDAKDEDDYTPGK